MSPNQIIENLLSANRLAEATLMKLTITDPEQRKWTMEAIERLGKAQIDTKWWKKAL